MIIAAMVFAVAGASIALVIYRADEHPAVVPVARGEHAAPKAPHDEPIAPSAARDVPPPDAIVAPPMVSRRASERRPAKTPSTAARTLVKVKEQPKPRPVSKKDGPDRPIARQALDWVGADPMAEAIWVQAINDPSITAHDRQDLIEDLNENGFDDPAHPSADDLPLIENRIAIIEQLAPDSMDEVNAAAFAEAYKDLINMHAKAVADQ
jgi:hypothetical protein